MVRVYSYVRFSRLKQRKGDSTERQNRKRDALCARKGWTLDESLTYTDPGLSAYRSLNAKDGALAVFLAAISAEKVPVGSILIVESLDRLSRDKIRIALRLFLSILDAGVTIWTLDPEREYTADSTNDIAGIVEPIIIMARANEESERKSGFSNSMWDKKRKNMAERKPLGKQCPAWLRLKTDKSGYEEIPSVVAIIKVVYRLAKQDETGAYTIARELQAKGMKSPGRSGRWNPTYIQKLLKDRSVCGEYQPHRIIDGKRVPFGKPIPGYFPVVIDEQDWYSVQGKKKQRKTLRGATGNGVANLFTSLMFDSRTGTTMRVWDKSQGDKRKYVTPAAAREGIAGGIYISFPYDLIENGVLGLVTELRPIDLSGEYDRRAAEIEALDGQLIEVRERISRIKARMASDPDLDSLIDVVAEMRRAEKGLADRRDTLAAEQETALEKLSDTQALVKLLASVQGEERTELRRRLRAKLARLIERINVTIKPEGRARKAEIVVRWKRGDIGVVHLHSRTGMIDAERYKAEFVKYVSFTIFGDENTVHSSLP